MTPDELQKRVVIRFLRGTSLEDIARELGELPFVVERVVREAFVQTLQCVNDQQTKGSVITHG